MFGRPGGSESAEALVVAGGIVIAIELKDKLVAFAKEMKDAPWLKDKDDANADFRATLGSIVRDNKNLGLRPFLTLKAKKEEKEPDNWEYKHMSHEDLEDYVRPPIIPEDADLQYYCDCIHNAIKCLFAFEDELATERMLGFKKGEHNVTAIINVSVIVLLRENCASFQGYEIDQLILPQVRAFLRKYGYRGKQHKDEIDHYNNACKYLLEAESELLRHAKTLSFVDRLDSLYRKCRNTNEALVRSTLGLVTLEPNHKFIKNARFPEVAEGSLKPAFAHGLTWHNAAITIPESPYKMGVMQNAYDFEASLEATNPQPKRLFVVKADKFPKPVFTTEELHHKPPGFMEKIKHKKLEPIDIYRDYFSTNVQWWTANAEISTSRLKDAVFLKPIQEAEEIAKRAPFPPMINEISFKISIIQYFCLVAKAERKRHGDDAIDAPHHCNFSIEIISDFGKLLLQDAEDALALIMHTKEGHANNMLPDVPATQQETLQNQLEEIDKFIAPEVKELLHLHNRLVKEKSNAQGTIQPGTSRMLALCVDIATEYKIMSRHDIEEKEHQEEIDDATMTLPEVSVNKPSVSRSALSMPQTPRTGAVVGGATPSVSTRGTGNFNFTTPGKPKLPTTTPVPSSSAVILSTSRPSASSGAQNSGLSSSPPPIQPIFSSPAPQDGKKDGKEQAFTITSSPLPTSNPSGAPDKPKPTDPSTSAGQSSPPPAPLLAKKLTTDEVLNLIDQQIKVVQKNNPHFSQVQLDEYKTLHQSLLDLSVEGLTLKIRGKSEADKVRGKNIHHLAHTLAELVQQYFKGDISGNKCNLDIYDRLNESQKDIDQGGNSLFQTAARKAVDAFCSVRTKLIVDVSHSSTNTATVH